MAASSGVTLGHGTTVRIGRGSTPDWHDIVGPEEAQFPDQTPTDVDVTWLGSPNATEEAIRGLKTVGTLALPLHYVPGSATDILLTELEEAGSDEDIILEITPSGGGAHRWVAYVNTYRMSSAPAKDKKMAEVTFKVKAKISAGLPAAPVNTTLPAISGVAQVGVVLTGWPGIWNPTGTLSFQWQQLDGTWQDIAGATGQSFTPLPEHEGEQLRLVVSASNQTGATSAISAPTAVVAEA